MGSVLLRIFLCDKTHKKLLWVNKTMNMYGNMSRYNRELCFFRLRVKVGRSRRKIQNDRIYNLRYYPYFLDIFKNIHLK